MSQSRRILASLLASLLVIVGAIRLGGYLIGWDVKMDHMLFRQQVTNGPSGMNRMVPNTAMNFLLLGLSLLLWDVNWF